MASRTARILSSLAALCAAAGLPSALPESGATELLQTAQATADRIADSPAAADDLVGDVTLRILERHPEAFDDPDGWRGYVRQCVRNAYRDELRRRGRLWHVTDLDADEDGEHETDLSFAALAVGDDLDAVAVGEFRDRLAPPEREVLDLLERGYRDRFIAESLQRTRHDVRTSQLRIRRAAERVFGDAVPVRPDAA